MVNGGAFERRFLLARFSRGNSEAGFGTALQVEGHSPGNAKVAKGNSPFGQLARFSRGNSEAGFGMALQVEEHSPGNAKVANGNRPFGWVTPR